jgi:hypothetical protein
MNKTLGIDLGTSSIGWAIFDDKNKVPDSGVKLINLRQAKRSNRTRKQIAPTTTTLIIDNSAKKTPVTMKIFYCLTATSFTMAIVDMNNWQFWINVGLTSLLTTLTLIHAGRK